MDRDEDVSLEVPQHEVAHAPELVGAADAEMPPEPEVLVNRTSQSRDRGPGVRLPTPKSWPSPTLPQPVVKVAVEPASPRSVQGIVTEPPLERSASPLDISMHDAGPQIDAKPVEQASGNLPPLPVQSPESMQSFDPALLSAPASINIPFPSLDPTPTSQSKGGPSISYVEAETTSTEAPDVAAADASAISEVEAQASHAQAHYAAEKVRGTSPQASNVSQPTTASIPAPAQERQLNVKDALSYLDAVKVQFQEQPDVYNHFLDIMKDFKSQLIDTPGVIKRVSYLFNGHPELIQGFNTFLPIGYRIDAQSKDTITVTTPTGTMMQTKSGADAAGKGVLSWSVTGRESLTSTGDAGVLALGPGSIGVADTMASSNMDGRPPPTQATFSRVSGSPDPNMYGYGLDGQAIEPAVQYVQKIKQRCDAETYKQFLGILSRYHQKADMIDESEVHAQISRLFKDDPDLRSDFKIFMPEKSQSMFEELDDMAYDAPAPSERRSGRTGTPILDKAANAKRGKDKSDLSLPTVPQKRKRKIDMDKGKEIPNVSGKGVAVNKSKKIKQQQHGSNDISPPSFSQSKYHASEASPRRSSLQTHSHSASHPSHHAPPPAPTPVNDQSKFFDRVRRVLDSRETYNEFLKLVNLFTQDIIDTARLVKESRHFLGDTDLMRQWRDILGWDDKRERESWLRESQEAELTSWARGPGSAVAGVVLERPGRKGLSVRYGSYRKLSSSEINVTCSGRDEMCRSVLNDEWVSHPTWSSEDSGFLAPKKNVYEEALHRSEEERHEYDFHIEAIVRTISMLEPINNKIAQLPNEERGSFKLKANLGGSGKSIHQRVIKKIYGREAGLEVIQAMQDSPSLAIPVVLTRLKLKEEEWKRAQREWNKVWREVDARNYQKSLDHQGITFKAADKKAISTKAFVSQIEAARDEQMAKRASLIDPLFARTKPRHHLEFVLEDVSVLQDSLKLTFSFLDRTTHQIGALERKKIESMLRGFVPTFFLIDPNTFNQAFTTVVPNADNVDSDMSDEVGSVIDDADISSIATSSSKTGRNGRKGGVTSSGGDLRKKLLKSEQAKSTGRKTRAQEAASPSGSRQPTPAISDVMMVDGVEDGLPSADNSPSRTRRTRKNVFFSNTTCYVFLRLIELLYSRLLLFKTLSSSLTIVHPTRPKGPSSFQEQLTELKSRHELSHAEHFYDLMLESCEKLFDNEIEQQAFEDQMRSMFGIKEAYKIFTIDKLIGAVIKQIQNILVDPKSQELLELLKKERAHDTLTTQDQIKNRQNVERIIGPDENLFRIDWLRDCKTMTVQLLGKDDSSFDDSEVSTGRWQAYVDSYVMTTETENLPPNRLRRPFLRKNLSPAVNGTHPKVIARGGLEIKVCVRTYRLFYVSNTEEMMWGLRDREEEQTASRNVEVRKRLCKKWMDRANAASLPPASTS